MSQIEETTYVIEESAMTRTCDMWFAVPPGFIEIPLRNLFAAPDSSESVRLVEALNSVLLLVPTPNRQDLFSRLAAARQVAELTLKEGVAHVSIGAHESDDGGLLESVLTITRKEVPYSPPRLMAVRAATSRKSVMPVALMDLPCGPCAFVEALMEVPTGAHDERHSMYEVSAYLPFPDGRKLAVLTLSTTHVEARTHYRDILRGIAEAVSFDNPLPEHMKEQIPESETAASVRAVFG